MSFVFTLLASLFGFALVSYGLAKLARINDEIDYLLIILSFLFGLTIMYKACI